MWKFIPPEIDGSSANPDWLVTIESLLDLPFATKNIINETLLVF